MKKLSDMTSSEFARVFALGRYIYYSIIFLFVIAFVVSRNVMFHIPLFISYIVIYMIGFWACYHIKVDLERAVVRAGLCFAVINLFSNLFLIGRLHVCCNFAFVIIEVDNLLWLISRIVKLNYLVKEGIKIGHK